jgi:hypothetical protein
MQLVVVGDQNTGKSSVLQAITEISFPVEAAMCTRFPIKISFRQTHSSKTTVLATIHPGPFSECDDALIKRTKEFRLERDKLTVEVMDEIVREVTARALRCFDSTVHSPAPGNPKDIRGGTASEFRTQRTQHGVTHGAERRYPAHRAFGST